MNILGIDIGSSSVGTSWIDTEKQRLVLGASVFPPGVEETKDKRGAPKNQKRREKRSGRRQTARRSKLRRMLRKQLAGWGWMPTDPRGIENWENKNPWELRSEGLERALTPEEFGRVLLHLAQRRGASWFEETEQQDEKKDKKKGTDKRTPNEANEELREQIEKTGAKTFGQFMFALMQQRQNAAIRNRQDAEGNPVYEFFPDRQMLIDEFLQLWKRQKEENGPLSEQLTEERKRLLYEPQGNDIWRCRGLLWGQRNTYWDTGTLGRCDLEPTDQVCPKADMYAQEFLVLQSVNNIRITPPGESSRPLNAEERGKVIEALSSQKTGSPATVRKALGVNRGEKKKAYVLNIDADPKQKLNTNWFRREIVTAIGPEKWDSMDGKVKESINSAIVKFDPKDPQHVEKLADGCRKWWNFTDGQAEAFIEAWKTRPRREDRTNLSQKAIINLLPHLRNGYTVTEARQLFAQDGENGATDLQRRRYSLEPNPPNRKIRRFLEKHPDLLPPAPALSNPVVRKAIHEVRRHVVEHLRREGKRPDRVIVELARDAKHTAVVRNRQTRENRARRKIRDDIRQQFAHILKGKTKSQEAKAIDRIVLCRQQREMCAYSNLGDGKDARKIHEETAAKGKDLEIDHIIPRSRGGSNGLHNRILCYAETNRGKGSQTPKEWLSDRQFAAMEQRFRHWKADKELLRKWQILHKDAPAMEDYVQNQLNDTAYASRQVSQWLKQVLFPNDTDNRRRVFTTTGRYTALLRRFWGLHYDEREINTREKSRADHRHHAIDALVIGLTDPKRIHKLAEIAQQEEISNTSGQPAPDNEPQIDTPWGDKPSFRQQVIEQVKNLVVSHRPQRRKIAGPLHKDTLYGPILDENGSVSEYFRSKIPAAKLTSKHLRVPKGWENLRKKLEKALTRAEKRKIRQEMLALEDVKPEKSGVVRDRWFREEMRKCLRDNGLNPDEFTQKQLRELIRNGRLKNSGGVPVRRITLLRTFKNISHIKRRIPDPVTGELKVDKNPKSIRAYELQSNHHIEIREKNGKWNGRVVTTLEAAQRVHPSKETGRNPRPAAVCRDDNDDGKFIMSLSIGEMVYMKDPKTSVPGFFVVFKIDGGGTIHFTPHWDAGSATEKEDFPKRQDEAKSSAQLQRLGPDEETPPQKVWVSPLGDVKFLRGD